MDEIEEWLKGRPESIRAAYAKRPNTRLYKLHGQIVFIMSYIEPDAGAGLCEHCRAKQWPQHSHQGLPHEATASVGVSRRFNSGVLQEVRVWGVKLDDLVPISPEEQALVDQSLAAELN